MSGLEKAGRVPGNGGPPDRKNVGGKSGTPLGVVKEGDKKATAVVKSKEKGAPGAGTLEEKRTSLKADAPKPHRDSVDSTTSWGSGDSGTETGFRLFGHPERPLEGELQSKERMQTGRSPKADELGQKPLKDRAAHLKSQVEGHTTDSGGSPMVSFTLDPVNLWRSGDQKLLHMLVNADYLAVGHFSPDEMVVPRSHFNNQVKEMEFVVVPKDGELQEKVDVYPNPFKGMNLNQSEEDLVADAKARWGAFLQERRIDPAKMKVAIRNPEVAEEGFHKTRTPEEGVAGLEKTYPQRPGKGATWGKAGESFEEKRERLKKTRHPAQKPGDDGAGKKPDDTSSV